MTVRKIALVETRAVKTHVFSRVYLPRLGLPIISGVLKKAGYEVELFIQELGDVNENRLAEFDLIGISSITSTVQEAYRLGSAMTARNIPVVMGGPHVSASPEEALEHCDYVVRGEGEGAIVQLLEAMNNGQDVSTVPSLSFRQNGGVTHNPPPKAMLDLEQLPTSDFSSCKSYTGVRDYPPQAMLSRGCPYGCNFCSVTTTFGRKYRYKKTAQIVEDLLPFADRSVCFVDDNFAAVPKKTKELLHALLASKKRPRRFSCQLRIEAARNEELLDLLRRAGCRIAYIGMESINPETLKQFNKGQTLEQMKAAIKKFRRYNIGIHGMFVLGGDNDTVDTIRHTVDFALDAGLDTIQLCALTPFPGTAIHKEMAAQKRILHTKWERYDGLHVVIQPAKMTPYELQTGIVREMERFYSLKNALKIDRHKLWRIKYRLGGRYLVKRWIEENRDYYDYLKAL